MTIERLIAALQEFIDAGLPPGAAVYVWEKTTLNGARWVSPRTLEPGPSPYPISDTFPPSIVVFIS